MLAIPMALAAATQFGCGRTPPTEPAPRASSAVAAPMERVGKKQVPIFYEAVGTVRSKTTTDLASRIVGHVVAVNIKEGDRVKRSQVLAEIDDRDMVAQRRKAEAGLKEAEGALAELEQATRAAESTRVAAEANSNLAAAKYRRYQALLERHSVSQQEFEEVEARYKAAVAETRRADEIRRSTMAKKEQVTAKIEQAKADVTHAELYLSYTKILSPLDGLVTMKNIDAGGLATPGAVLLRVEDGKEYRLEATVEESRVNQIHIGDRATVRLDASAGGDLPASVVEIVPAADPASRSFTVKLDLPARSFLRTGMYGKAQFPLGQREAVTLPYAAILERGQLTGVYVVGKDDVARFRLIKTGAQFGERLEILSGLHEGETVVVGGIEQVRDGTRIKGQ